MNKGNDQGVCQSTIFSPKSYVLSTRIIPGVTKDKPTTYRGQSCFFLLTEKNVQYLSLLFCFGRLIPHPDNEGEIVVR